MTIVPFVVAMLITRIAGASAGAVGRVGGRALVLFVLLALASAALGLVLAPPLVAALPIDPSALDAVRARAVAPSGTVPPFRDWLTGLVPPNPIKAAADGALLPLVVFTVCFGLALTRIDEGSRQAVVGFFEAIARAMSVLIGWIIALSPVGVFALGAALAGRGGIGVAGAVGLYVLALAGLLLIATMVLYPAVSILGRAAPRQFARAAAPAQVIGFSTRSSLAALPVLIDRAEHGLGVSRDVAALVLPIAVSISKYGTPIARLTGACFVARLYGVPLDAGELVMLAAALVVVSFYTPGVPSGSLFILAPIFEVFRLPVEGLGLMLAVDLVPDMFLTVANLTGYMTVAALLARPARPAGVRSAGV
jgi:Na+/H+-dicarboxylate symporter